MKRATLTAISLTLLMFLLVAVSAFVFLYQGRVGLQNEVSTLAAGQNQMQQELLQTGSNLAAVQATRDLVQEALSTAEADKVLLEGELVTNQQEVDNLSYQLATATAELATTVTDLERLETASLSVQAQPPNVEIVMPEDGASFAPGEPVFIVLAASDYASLTAVELKIDDEVLQSYEISGDVLFAAQTEWVTDTPGDYLLEVTAVNENGRTSDPIAITITITLSPEEALAALRAIIEANVIEIRGLEPLEPIVPTLLTSQELRQRIEADMAEETTPEDARHDTLVYSAFDFISRDYDLYQALIDLYSEAVAGFYDPETAEFVVVSDSNEMGANQQWTHAHEFMHALQDQYYPLELISDDTVDSEAKAALRAVAEGEATLIQLLYLRGGYFTQGQINEIIASFNEPANPLLDDLPPILISSLAFPYDAGFTFIMQMYNGGDLSLTTPGDFANIEAVWNNLPQSSEQIIHPERYLAGDNPIPVSLPPLTSTLGTGWQQLDEGTFGEFTLREYLKQQLTEAATDQAATGWGGDRYTVFWNEAEQELVMVLRIVWDTVQDAAEFAALYPDYPAGLFGVESGTWRDGECWQGADAICLFHSGRESLIVRAPDPETAVRLQARIYP